MPTLETISEQLNISAAAQHTVAKVLGRVDESILNTWLEKLRISNGRVVGTFYSELGSTLSFSDFTALYQALGYDLGELSLWQDWWCYGAEGCKRQSGYTCDTSACP